VLNIDFSKAFDVVDHEVLLTEICALELLPEIHNWLVSFLHFNGVKSSIHLVTRGISLCI